MRTVLIAGEPATGKSSLVQSLLPELGDGLPFKDKTMRGTLHPRYMIWVLGLYSPGTPFGGTDRLSMGCMLDALKWLKKHSTTDKLLLEGDRLTCRGFLDAVADDCALFMLKASPEVKKFRHEQRNDTQSQVFLKGRETKCANLLREYPFRVLKNENPADQQVNRALILKELGVTP